LTAAAVGMEEEPPLPTWAQGLTRTGGHWGHPDWYEHHLNIRLPLVPKMMDALLASCPPLSKGHRVCDLLAGTGKVTRHLLPVYPNATYTLVDMSEERLSIAAAHIDDAASCGSGRLCDTNQQVHMVKAKIEIQAESKLPMPPSKSDDLGYDLVCAVLATRVLVSPAKHYQDADHKEDGRSHKELYSDLFTMVLSSLRPGGHLLIGDHVGALGLFDHLKLMEEAGFEEVDCSWRERDFFVCGGRKPLTNLEHRQPKNI